MLFILHMTLAWQCVSRFSGIPANMEYLRAGLFYFLLFISPEDSQNIVKKTTK